MTFIWYTLFILGGVFLLITLYLWFLAFASLWPEKRQPPDSDSERRFAIVVPAHNESKVIRRTIDSLKGLDYPAAGYEIIVVADNCTDDTARIVRDSGIKCLERSDSDRRGKGFALDWAFTQLKGNPFDAFVIVDADTIMDRDFLRAMNRRLSRGEKAVQGYYDVISPEKSPMASLSYLGFVLSRNLRYKGRARLGWSSNLLGNGMCFTKEIIDRYGWPAKSIVEDIEFEMLLVSDGIRVDFAPEARIYAEIPGSFEDSTVQRTRWDLGKFGVRNQYLPRLLREGIRRKDPGCFDSALELIIPPYSLYWFLMLTLFVAAVAVTWGDFDFLFVLWSGVLAASILYAFLGLIIARAGWQIYRNLLFVPLFLLWRVKIVVQGYFSGAATQWLKTKR